MVTIIILKKEQYEDIVSRLAKIERALNQLLSAPVKPPKSTPGTDLMKGFISNRELCLQLGVTKRTLARYRASGLLRYSIICGRVYYSEADVNGLMKSFNRKKKPVN